MTKKLNKKQFVFRAIEKLRKPYTDKKGNKVNPSGIHTVYSGFNQAFKEYFNDDPIKSVTALVEKGELDGHPTKGGFMIYKPGEMPKAKSSSGTKALKDMELL